jgi:hypothetical protein
LCKRSGKRSRRSGPSRIQLHAAPKATRTSFSRTSATFAFSVERGTELTDAYEQIVRDIASQDPVRETNDREGWPNFSCWYCDVGSSSWYSYNYFHNRAVLDEYRDKSRVPTRQYVDEHHAPDCLWRRCKEAVAQPESNDERTLHVTVSSSGDWVLENDAGGTPTRVAVKW